MSKVSFEVLKKKCTVLREKDVVIGPLRALLETKNFRCFDFFCIYPYIVHLVIPNRGVIIEINKPVVDGDDFFRTNHFKELGFAYKNFEHFDFNQIFNFIMDSPVNKKAMREANKFATDSLTNKKTGYTLSQPYVKIKYD